MPGTDAPPQVGPSQAMAHMTTPPTSALGAGGVVGVSGEDLAAELTDAIRVRAMADGRIVAAVEKAGREETFREDGATSIEAWLVERFGVSVATARAYSHVAEKAPGLPHLLGSLRAGEISFDKVRAVVDVATPRTERDFCQQAKDLSVRELAEVARTAAARARSASVSPSRSEHDSRYARFNDEHRTMSVQLPQEAYAQTKACVDAWAETVVSENKMPLDQRRCDG